MDSTVFRIRCWCMLLPLFLLLTTQVPVYLALDQNQDRGNLKALTAAAQSPDPTWTTSSQTTSTSSAPAQTHTIEVGGADHTFRPDVTEADVGDVRVSLSFYMPALRALVLYPRCLAFNFPSCTRQDENIAHSTPRSSSSASTLPTIVLSAPNTDTHAYLMR